MINTYIVVFIIKKIVMKSYNYKNKDAAEKAAGELGCSGTHRHRKAYMPCKTHKDFLKYVKKNNGGEIDELVDYDGSMKNSKTPILDPKVTARGTDTMDKTVAMTRTTQDPLMRGYRVYYGESTEEKIKEEDMSGAYGYDETKDMDAEETKKYFEDELGFDEDDAEDRAEEMGKDEDLDDSSEYKNKKDFIGKSRLTEKNKILSKEEVIKMAEDLMVKKTEDSEINTGDTPIKAIIKRNARALKNMAISNGISTKQLIRILKNEQ